MNEKIIVIIPIHKSSLSDSEKISLLQCKKMLSKYSVCLVYPSDLTVSIYTDLYPELYLKPVPSYWLSSIEFYNRMKCSATFYKLFEAFDFMLTYELDSYIFSDNWDAANCFQYDYIGAPWFEGFNSADAHSKITGVGNSGFSMRNIKKCLSILNKVEKIKKRWIFFDKLGLSKLIRFTLLLRLFDGIWKVTANNYYFIPLTTDGHINEDNFWGLIVPHVFTFKVATITDSIKFSFEVNPSHLYKANNYRLPLGCHGWEKYEPDFWKKHILNAETE